MGDAQAIGLQWSLLGLFFKETPEKAQNRASSSALLAARSCEQSLTPAAMAVT